MQARWMLDTQTVASGRAPEAVTVFGGPTANPTWMWIKTQVSPAPVTIVSGLRCAALGAAQLAGQAIGVASSPVPGEVRKPDPEHAPDWETAYRSTFLPLAQAERPQEPDSEERQ